MYRHLQIFADISKAAKGDESRGCPFREGRQKVDKKKTKVPEKNQNESQERRCKFCSKHHPFTKKNCPAWGTSCKNCGKPNQFAVCCQESKKKVLSVDYTSEDEEYEYVAEIKVKEQVNALAPSRHPKKSFCHSTGQWKPGNVSIRQWINSKHND